jgi:transposase InsO family protein
MARELDLIIAEARRPRSIVQRQRQRPRQHGDPTLVAREIDQLALYRARRANPERLHREFKWPAELLNEVLFVSLDHTHESLRDWKDDYNTVRPNSALGNVPPTVCANLSDPTTHLDGSLELHEGMRPVPLLRRAIKLK